MVYLYDFKKFIYSDEYDFTKIEIFLNLLLETEHQIRAP